MALRVLVVDDNPQFLAAARELLERQGLAVVAVASTSAEALRQVEELRPDVTLVDIDLGAESGFELARQLAGSSGLSSPVVLISTHAEDDLRELIEESPALGFVSKTELSRTALHRLVEAAGGDGRAVPDLP